MSHVFHGWCWKILARAGFAATLRLVLSLHGAVGQTVVRVEPAGHGGMGLMLPPALLQNSFGRFCIMLAIAWPAPSRSGSSLRIRKIIGRTQKLPVSPVMVELHAAWPSAP